MTENIERIKEEARSKLTSVGSSEELEHLRVHYLGKKGVVTSLLHQLRELEGEKRRELGASLNGLKEEIESALEKRKGEFVRTEMDRELQKSAPLDITLPGILAQSVGSLHPITQVLTQSVECLKRIGFSIASGPEVETNFYNFEALNTPEDHPARDVQDTFYLQSGTVLRSHTSPVQIRAMQSHQPPIQAIAVGKVYRSDYDVTHTPMFHQLEGLMVDYHISFSDLKGVLHHLIGELFGERTLRFRPSYFPFTEPSAEVDMRCLCKDGEMKGLLGKNQGNLEKSQGLLGKNQGNLPSYAGAPPCRLCKDTGWIEVGGCGMVHPHVFGAVGYDSDSISGFAFGMGLERIAMLKYGVDDLRSFFENDIRLLEQF